MIRHDEFRTLKRELLPEVVDRRQEGLRTRESSHRLQNPYPDGTRVPRLRGRGKEEEHDEGEQRFAESRPALSRAVPDERRPSRRHYAGAGRA